MKINITLKITFMMLLLFHGIIHEGKSQDIIFKLDNTKIEAQISEISETVVKYYKFQNLKGPTYSLNISEVSHIKYSDGSVEYYARKKEEVENIVPQKAEVVIPKQEVAIPLPQKAIIQKQEAKIAPTVDYKPKILPKIIVAVIGIGGGGFAYLTKYNYDKKISNLNTLTEQFEKDATGKIYKKMDFESYSTSFNEIQKLKTDSENKIVIGLGVAGVALIAETYLLIKKPKNRNFSLKPTLDGAQLTVNF
jgi:hypothetical protein